jgi:hypothetical protein
VLARGASLLQGQVMMAELGQAAATAIQAHGVVDGSISFRQPSGLVARVAHLSGTADPATRAPAPDLDADRAAILKELGL